jgi:subtilisin family serine protease
VLVVAIVALAAGAFAPATLAADPPAADGDLVDAIVTFKQKPGKTADAALAKLQAKLERKFDLIPGAAVRLSPQALQQLRRNPLVKSVEVDHKLELFEHSGTTGDLEYENAWGVEHIGTKAAHDAGYRGQGIKLAVIDTGVDYIHDDPDDQPYNVDPEFNSNYRGGYDFFNNDADPMDDNGHGTHVSGIAAAEKNGYLVVGVAPQVDLYALKVLGADGSGEYSGLIAALDWAVQNDMDVVNMSLGGHEPSAALQAAIQAAYASGITLVAASGNAVTINDLIYGCPVAYPAAYDEVIAVSFTDANNKLTGFSCTGPQVDNAAPGNQIYSPVPVGNCMFCTPYGYRAESGTSMASPHVAGVAALILSHGIANNGNPATLADDVKAHLCATSTQANMSPTDPRYPNFYGCGIVNARRAIVDNPPPPPVGGNQPPVAVDDSAATTEDAPVDVDVLANDSDPDGIDLSVASVTVPLFGSASINANGTVRYTPNLNANGTDHFDYRLSDGSGGIDTGTVTVSVMPVNDPPTGVDDTAVTGMDTPAAIPVLANDTDPDDDPLLLDSVTDPANGSVTVESDGSITYFPDPGYQGADGFDYTLTDGTLSDTAHVSVNVVPVNHAPVAIDDSLTTAEDTAASLNPAANDVDSDGNALVVTAVTQPGHGSAVLGAGGIVTYTPAANYSGLDSFDYTIDDGAGGTDTGSVNVNVTPVNDAPVANEDSVTVAEDGSVSLAAASNDTDADGDALAISSVGTPVHGSASIQPNGTILYAPAANYFGNDAFSYTVSDGQGGSATGLVAVTVTAVNDAPVALDVSAATAFQTQVALQLVGRDLESCNVTFQVVTPPAHGSLTALTNVACTTSTVPYTDYSRPKYTPAAGFAGTDSFTYRVSDGTLWSAPATYTITVSDPILYHSGDLDWTKTTQSTTWTPKVTVTVHNGTEGPVSGVRVTFGWDRDGTTVACTTNSGGFCQVSRPGVPKSVTVVTFWIAGATLQTGIYHPELNHDPDGNSNGTTIQVFGP